MSKIITLPYQYNAIVVKNRKRKPETIVIRDEMEFEIPERKRSDMIDSLAVTLTDRQNNENKEYFECDNFYVTNATDSSNKLVSFRKQRKENMPEAWKKIYDMLDDSNVTPVAKNTGGYEGLGSFSYGKSEFGSMDKPASLSLENWVAIEKYMFYIHNNGFTIPELSDLDNLSKYIEDDKKAQQNILKQQMADSFIMDGVFYMKEKMPKFNLNINNKIDSNNETHNSIHVFNEGFYNTKIVFEFDIKDAENIVFLFNKLAPSLIPDKNIANTLKQRLFKYRHFDIEIHNKEESSINYNNIITNINYMTKQWENHIWSINPESIITIAEWEKIRRANQDTTDAVQMDVLINSFRIFCEQMNDEVKKPQLWSGPLKPSEIIDYYVQAMNEKTASHVYIGNKGLHAEKRQKTPKMKI